MDIRQLEAFVYTVKYQSFSLAAQKLYLSQPTVSSHINNLEKELHTQLLKRTTKSLSVTPAGQTLYNYAAEILNLQQKAILELSDKNQKLLHIGVSSVPSSIFCRNCCRRTIRKCRMPASVPAARTVWMSFGK